MNFKKLLLHHGRQLGTLAGLLLLVLALSLRTPYFLTVSNLLTVLEQVSINAIVAVGMTVVIITAGIDLSVGSILAFAGVVMATVLQKDLPVPLGLAVGLGVGVGCGLLNGLLITIGRLPPFIATLGMMSIARGGALLFTNGRPVSGFSDGFRALATSQFLYIPMPTLIMLGVYVACHLLLTRTRFGLYAYAMGGNEQATHLSGINVRLHKTLVYGLCGLTSAIAAVILTARLNSAQPIAGMTYELDAIAATVIGGASLMGGQGTLVGTLIGALLMGVLRNGLNLLEVSSFLQQVIIGAVIIVAVLLDMTLKQNRK
ncbi:MAG: ribose ABC transporter permease [Verrucomicrobiales bacterium]|nr:ribose ABC transporter permease [Verrucomicrobiales bacterium]